MFRALIGDLFASPAQTLVNTVNCVGVMGKGVALDFKKRFSANFADYSKRCERKHVRPGEPYPFADPSGTLIINFPTKNHWRSPARISDIEAGLNHLVAHWQAWGVKSLALPPLGCGNGGLEWSEVGPLIYRKLHALPIDVELYAPFGTPKNQLTDEFLSSPSQMTLDGKGRSHEKMNPEWAVLMEVLKELERQPYASPVGRTIFQKICYVLTEMGVETGFKFDKGSYGPFADDVKLALHEFANRNWLQEQPLGRMIALKVNAKYEADRRKYEDAIRRHEHRIGKTVDLFSRIKSTDQAEEVVTVLFACRNIRRAHPRADVSEEDLLRFILDWKKSWYTNDKIDSVEETIRSLVALGWMRVKLKEPAEESA